MADGDRSTLPRQRGGRIVPARYLEYEKKTYEKGTSTTLLCAPKGLDEAASPNRPPTSFRKYKLSEEHRPRTLQSTFLDSSGNSWPELEVSVIKDMRNLQALVLTPGQDTTGRNLAEASADSSYLTEMLDSQTLLLSCASVEMEKNLALLEEKAESSLLVLLEEEDWLQEEIHRNQRRLQHLNDSKISKMLDVQLEVLDPVAELCVQFEEGYRHFATTLDSTRHELPVEALTLGEEKALDLAGLEKALAESRSLLGEVLQAHSRENVRALPLLKELNEESQILDEELPRSLAQVLHLSAEASKEAVLHCQQVNEGSLDMETMECLYLK